MSVRYERRAEHDLHVVVEQTRSQGHPDPEAFAKLLRYRIASIALFPNSGRPVPETSVREWPLQGSPYIVVYVPHATGIDVLRVINSNADDEDEVE